MPGWSPLINYEREKNATNLCVEYMNEKTKWRIPHTNYQTITTEHYLFKS